jgi:hypothetical protein
VHARAQADDVERRAGHDQQAAERAGASRSRAPRIAAISSPYSHPERRRQQPQQRA